MMKNKGIIFVFLIVAFIVVSGGSFWLGMKYQEQRFQSMRAGFRSMFPGQGGQTETPAGIPQGLGRDEQGPVTLMGKVDKVDSESITMTTRFGSQKVSLTSKVAVMKPDPISLDELKVGAEVIIQGERDNQGNVEAKEILITTFLEK